MLRVASREHGTQEHGTQGTDTGRAMLLLWIFG